VRQRCAPLASSRTLRRRTDNSQSPGRAGAEVPPPGSTWTQATRSSHRFQVRCSWALSAVLLTAWASHLPSLPASSPPEWTDPVDVAPLPSKVRERSPVALASWDSPEPPEPWDDSESVSLDELPRPTPPSLNEGDPDPALRSLDLPFELPFDLPQSGSSVTCDEGAFTESREGLGSDPNAQPHRPGWLPDLFHHAQGLSSRCQHALGVPGGYGEWFAGLGSLQTPVNYVQQFGSSSLGPQIGFNAGMPIHWLADELSYQYGFRALATNGYGSTFTDDSRQQVYLTGGLFRRTDYGLQGGLAWDYLHEAWYFQADVWQMRGEFTWRTEFAGELGIRFAGGLNTDRDDLDLRNGAELFLPNSRYFEAADQTRFLYRYSWSERSWCEASIGGTSRDALVIGGQLELALMPQVSFRNEFTYVSGADGSRVRFAEEGWWLSFAFVWIPPHGIGAGYHRPLFQVADPGSFLNG